MNKNQIEGRINTAKGKGKEIVGEAVGNPELELKGKAQKTLGQIESKYGDAKDDLAKNKE